MVVSLCAGLASCSSAPATTRHVALDQSTTTTTPDQAVAANISKIISPENVWVQDAERDADQSKNPSIYESANSTAQTAASQLKALTLPASVHMQIAAAIAALQKVSSDSAQAVPAGADLTAIAQQLYKDQFSVLLNVNRALDALGSRSSFQISA
jgi:autotransporter adhesin